MTATGNCTIERVMQPKSDQQNRGLQVPTRDSQATTPPLSHQTAAANLMRQQIDQIYDQPQPNEQVASQAGATNDDNPYDDTHSTNDDIAAREANSQVSEHWKKYHSAWQQYYQMYYERYYQAQTKIPASTPLQEKPKEAEPEVITKDRAVDELRSELIKKVYSKTAKIRHSRNFMPTVVGLSVGLVLMFLQWNPLLFAQVHAFVSPASSETQNTIDPSTNVNVSQEPKIIIPKINVDAPVVYDIGTLDEPLIQSKLKDGVVHYPIPGANAMPGQVGNSVVLGHSSNDVFDDGKYKFIFVQLDRLDKGDVFYLHYQGTRYTYSVTEKKIIEPNQVSELVINNGKPLATLVTCTPPGTALKRLMVVAEQISPDPRDASQQTANQGEPIREPTKIGGDAPSFFERLFDVTN